MSSRSSSATSSGLLPRQRASARATASALHPQGACVITASYSERENLDKTLPNPLTKGAESNILLSLCGHGGTGRRVRLRGVWLTPSEFKSRWPHQKENTRSNSGVFFLVIAVWRLSPLERIGCFLSGYCGMAARAARTKGCFLSVYSDSVVRAARMNILLSFCGLR